MLSPLSHKSFFLFGPRGAGKSTFLSTHFEGRNALLFDLRDPVLLDELRLDPARFRVQAETAMAQGRPILVDEIQKYPTLLDYIHQFLEKQRGMFAFTGSSARRLKQMNVNFLAGRASVYDLFPLSSLELGNNFDLSKAVSRGGLPDSYLASSEESSQEFLRAYSLTYLEKEIQQEQWVRNLDPFRKFLTIASQMNGKLLNFSALARDVGVNDMTIRSYYEILVDTLMGFFIPAFHRSVRKQQSQAPKFYFVDPGIKRSLDRTLKVPLLPQTAAFGEAFEHWVILEIYKLASYLRSDWQFFYIRTKDNVEIDLVIQRPGNSLLLVEIKSKTKIYAPDAKNLERLGNDLDPKSTKYLLSNDPVRQTFGKTQAMHWQEGIQSLKILGGP
jgi:predicted AAA+ superfamily ATPase